MYRLWVATIMSIGSCEMHRTQQAQLKGKAYKKKASLGDL